VNKKQPERQLCNVKYMRLMLIVFLFSAIFLHSHAFAQSNDTLRVMILTSYFRGTEWTEGIMDGIQAEFKDPDQPIAMFVENIEVKQYHAENYFYKLKDLYEYRYSSVKFSVILVSDSYVLQFVKEYGKVLFPGVPVVFWFPLIPVWSMGSKPAQWVALSARRRCMGRWSLVWPRGF